MAHPLAICPHCSLLFESPIFGIPDGASLAFEGIGTNCPRCQKTDAVYINGVHKAVGDTVQIIADDPQVAAALPELIEALKKAKRDKASKEEIEQIIDEKAPALAGLKTLFSQNNRMEIWSILAILIPSLLAISLSSTTPTTQVIINKTIASCAAANPYVKRHPKKKGKRKPRVPKTRRR